MRSTAGIVAGLLVIGLFANCGSSDSDGGGGGGGSKAGTSNVGGEGGDGQTTGATSSGGTSSTAGKGGMPPAAGGEGGMPAVVPPPVGCTKDADCGAAAKCVDTVCKKNDGAACMATSECQNTCIDKVCTSKGADGTDCTADADCAHTCIDNVCAPVSDVGGDCDVDLGSGGAGGDGAGGNSSVAGAGGDSGSLPPVHDCKAPLQCFAGKCLTPDGEACTDNIDCLNTCVKNVCRPKATINGPCDDKSDCAVAALVCDETTATCKLDLLQQCTDNGQCKSDRCICSDANCAVRVCKAPNSVCQCRWSPADSSTCNNTSAALNKQTQDPNGCDASTSNICNGSGSCVANMGGDCVQACNDVANGPDMNPGTMDDVCAPAAAPTGCASGYTGTQKDGGCHTVKNLQGTYYCTATCACEL